MTMTTAAAAAAGAAVASVLRQDQSLLVPVDACSAQRPPVPSSPLHEAAAGLRMGFPFQEQKMTARMTWMMALLASSL